MFKALIVGVALFAGAEPAAFTFNVDAPEGASVTVKIDGREIKPGKVYEVPPFVGEKDVTFEVTFTDPLEGRVTKRGTFTVKAGYMTEITYRVPRHYARSPSPAD